MRGKEPKSSSRRKFLKGLAAMGAAYAIASTIPSRVDAETTGQLPLVDVHAHLLAELTPANIFPMMDKCGVARAVLMPRQSSGDGKGGIAPGKGVPEDYIFKFYENDYQRSRVIPLIGMMRPMLNGTPNDVDRWLHPEKDGQANWLLNLTESYLKKGIKGIGEFIMRHYEYRTADGKYIDPDIDCPIDSPLFYRFLDLAEKYDVPVDVHLEIDSKTLPSLEKVLQNRPNVKFILAHCGRADTETLNRLLNMYPKFFLECSCNMATQAYGMLFPETWRKNPHEESPSGAHAGELLPEWKKFYEDQGEAGRIIGIGSDLYNPYYQTGVYENMMNRWRIVLSNNLSESAARKIAYKNAEKMYLGSD